MAKFLVGVREVHVSTREVKAKNEKDALDRVVAGEGEEVVCEYSHTLDRELWTVEKFNREDRGAGIKRGQR